MTAIRKARFPEDRDTVHRLFSEYAGGLGFDLGFQSFERELATLPGAYAAPRGGVLLACDAGGEAFGCVALRPLDGATCEMKRLYVRPGSRGAGAGELLARAVLAEARAAGYARMRLDTVATMERAIALYERLGFRDIPPYCPNPIAGARYMEAELGPAD